MMASLIGRVWAWLGGKARLALEYMLLVAFIALAGWSVGTWWQNRATVKSLTENVTDLSGRLTGVSKDLTSAVSANKDQDAAIAELKRLRAIDSQALGELQGELSKADTKAERVRQKIAELEKTNADAKALLDTAVPPALGCVLDGTPCPGAAADHPDGGRHGETR
jgi:DNA-directed RNA polymerase subunit F